MAETTPAMTREQALQILTDVVRDGKRHKHYERTVSVAEKCYSLSTGEGLDKELQKFQPRETEEMFAQRTRITKHIVQTVVKNLIDVQYKVPRSNSITRVLKYENDNTSEQTQQFEEILDHFWGTDSFDQYMETRIVELNNIDPNAFMIVEFKDFDPDKEHLSPYPFEAKSAMAVMYEYSNKVLQYLAVQQENEYKQGTEIKKGTKTTLYNTNQAFILEQTYDQAVWPYLVKDEWLRINGIWYIRFNDNMYFLTEPEPYNLESVPGERVGYKRDLTTDGETYVSPYWDTVPLLEKTIKANSELDLAMCLHAFPQKIITGMRCDNEQCYGGYITTVDEKSGKEIRTVCPRCDGLGMLPHTSAQDVVIVHLPEAKEEQLSLDDIVRYIYPPIDLLNFQDEYIEKLTWRAKQTMFNSDIFTREEVAETATGKNIDLQNVYDTLWPFAVKYAQLWEFYVWVIAELTDMEQNLIYSFHFDKDFKMKTTTELYQDLKTASDSGADEHALDEIQADIMRNIFANSPDDFRKWVVMDSFKPFKGKTNEQKMTIMASDNTTQFYKTLHENYENIFNEIDLEIPDFYIMDRNKQWEILKERVNVMMGELDEQRTQSFNTENA
jgi:hypothetical protein